MSNVPVARRYARALLDAAGAEADQVLSQLEAVTAYLNGQPALFAALSSPTITRTERMKMTEAIISGADGLSKVVANVMKLLTDRSRFDTLPFITRQFRDLVDTRMGRVRGKVASATKLGDAQVKALEKQLEALTQRNVVLETTVDPSLIGGVVATVGSKMYDGSLKSQLVGMARSLK